MLLHVTIFLREDTGEISILGDDMKKKEQFSLFLISAKNFSFLLVCIPLKIEYWSTRLNISVWVKPYLAGTN